MTQYDNRNSGALFPNDRKTKASHPDYKGSMTDASGQEFWISAWVKQGKRVNSYRWHSRRKKTPQ